MNIADVDVSEYDEADRNYHEKLLGMFRYMIHIKPFVIEALTNSRDGVYVANLASVYANLSMVFGEFFAMTEMQTPNLSFKRKFFLEKTAKFNSLLGEYRKILPGDDMKLTDAEKKMVL